MNWFTVTVSLVAGVKMDRGGTEHEDGMGQAQVRFRSFLGCSSLATTWRENAQLNLLGSYHIKLNSRNIRYRILEKIALALSMNFQCFSEELLYDLCSRRAEQVTQLRYSLNCKWQVVREKMMSKVTIRIAAETIYHPFQLLKSYKVAQMSFDQA